MVCDGTSTGLSDSNCVITSFANATGIEGKCDVTSNATIHSSVSTVMPGIWSMNVFASKSACGEWRLRCFILKNSRLDSLYAGDPIKGISSIEVSPLCESKACHML